MSNSRLDGVRKGTRIPDLLLRRQSLYPTELYGPIVLKPAISRGLTPYIVFLGLDNILSEEGIIHGLLLSIYCRVRSHFSRRIELTTELLFFSRLVLALFLRRRPLYTAELLGHICFVHYRDILLRLFVVVKKNRHIFRREWNILSNSLFERSF